MRLEQTYTLTQQDFTPNVRLDKSKKWYNSASLDMFKRLLPESHSLLIAEDYEDIEYMTRKLVAEYEKWGLNINLKKTNYMAIGTVSKDLILEEGKGIINHCEEELHIFGSEINKY
ncbi:hypothetical protein C0J52_20223 [Blattella germanica]|nr:hypothetical protein C0J52_20223 [Blattella germanica]